VTCTETVEIIGAGIGGLYLVAELGIAGFKLRLHDIDDSRLSEIRARGGVDVEGKKGGFAAPARTAGYLRSACSGIITLPQPPGRRHRCSHVFSQIDL
jgi:2-polyprenyl-6-methoxyphenol hydroxylase-like FAD-dependent oxidoreductase